jgi:hypothetical protein
MKTIKMKTMKRIRLLVLAVSSCAAALLVSVLTGGEGDGYEYIPPSRSFAVVECPASVSDREVVGVLSGNGIQGVMSESTQFFLLSAWNGVEQVPLDMLEGRLLESDPRKDAYAQTLRAFFVNEKARRFFLPLSNWKNKNAGLIDAAVRDALSGVPVSSINLILHNPRSPLSRIFGMIGKTAVWAAIFMICGLCIPSFFKDFLSDRAYRLSGRGRKTRRGKVPVAVSLLLVAVFIASGVAEGGAASVSRLLRVVFPFALFLLGWTLPVWVGGRSARRRGHILFRPVAIRRAKSHSGRGRPLAIIVCLFAAGAIASTVSFFTGSSGLGLGGGTTGFSNEGYGRLVSEDEYHAHGWRQALFAHLPLGVDREEDAPPYRRYTEDADGLYVAAETVEMEIMENAFPAYPFNSLAAFIEGTSGPPNIISVPNTVAGLPEGVSLFFIALAALLPFVILDGRGLAG